MKVIINPLFILLMVVLSSCEIVQETRFNPNGSGTYSLSFDMSEMMKMGGNSQKDSTDNKQIDTVIHFSKFLEDKKDSIAKLTVEEQEKIKQLENFSFSMKADSVSNQLLMRIDYEFESIDDLKMFSDKLDGQKVDELDLFTKQLGLNKDKSKGLEDFNKSKSFKTTFSRSHFSSKITEEALQEAISKKDTTLTKDNPMSDMIRFKIRYIFPYKIKKISNKNALILSDFKGVEIYANIFEMHNNPKYFDLDVEFE